MYATGDQFIGWSPEQRRRRLPLVVNNSRLLILPDAHYPNLASCLLKQVLARLSDDWLACWGHSVALVETFVDPECGLPPKNGPQFRRL
ncbi:MAG: DUF4338 domain-containing protein [Opitutus sp.]|nr:DUF4338 domain-containing protein [Opitutus sp.]